ncbi:RCC1 domain-containing protein, partial [Aeromonas hydrophila]|uniref:hypothetical protein n=1 Tax=Aeromonas hydrophila TaxID=644 RepID=UPI0038D187B4
DTQLGGNTRDVIGADLENVKEVVGGDGAFAALRRDGKVATWGDFGSRDPDDLDFSALEGLDDVVSITANNRAFAALTRSGRVVVWGNKSTGGDNKALGNDLDSGVEAIVGTRVNLVFGRPGFAALKENGTVVSWGRVGKCDVCNDLTDVVEVVSSGGAFAARTGKGEVVAWGDKDYGGDTNTLPEGALTEVVQVVGNVHAFAARKRNGSVVAWGGRYNDGGTTQVAAQLNGDVVDIYAAAGGFAAVKKDGTVVSWGGDIDSTNVPTLLRPLSVVGNTGYEAGFAALNDDGTAVSWGSSSYGFDSPPGGDQLQDVRALFSTGFAFAALKGDGTVVTWGDGYEGGNSSTPAGGTLTGVQTIVGNLSAFAAIVTPPGAGQ